VRGARATQTLTHLRAFAPASGELPAGGVLAHFTATALEFLAGGTVTCARVPARLALSARCD
jgi:hypothetical protein